MGIAICGAQATGAITTMGKVVDENDAPVREAVVTVLPSKSTATSDAAGLFRLEIPAPGQYQIEAKREGFFLFTNQSALLDDDVPLEIHMNHLRELAESVDVHYSPPVIDPTQTSDTKRLNYQEILNVPYPS